MKQLQFVAKCATAALLGAASLVAQAGGNVVVVNETDSAIHPFFRYNCWATPMSADPNGWVFFGGIGARGQFGWDFNLLTDPNCKKPKLEFTFTVDPDLGPPANHPAVHQKLQFSPTTNFYMQNGERIRSYNLLDDDGDDD
jgi:hypothetical protein